MAINMLKTNTISKSAPLLAAFALLISGVLACGGLAPEQADEVIDLTLGKADGATLRTMSLTLSAGATKRYRVKATGFKAALAQTGAPVQATLSAKHYSYDIKGTSGVAPTVEAKADGTIRNWTLRVINLGTAQLSGTVTVTALTATTTTPELGIVSDIDKTVLPKHAATDPLPAPYPGVTALYQRLERGADGTGTLGDMYYVTARTPDRLTGIAAWMAQSGLPAGPIDTGVSTLPWVAQAEKVKDISAIFDANPKQSFVLFGDSSHRDPEVYREVIQKYGARVKIALIHKVNNPNPARLTGLHLVQSYAEVAALLYGKGLLGKQEARTLMQVARAEGLSITDAEIDALLAAQTPATAPFHGNTSSKSFHAPTCRYYHCKSCSVSFSTRDAAVAAGYHPCGVCKP
jgi:hypothetical protein